MPNRVTRFLCAPLRRNRVLGFSKPACLLIPLQAHGKRAALDKRSAPLR